MNKDGTLDDLLNMIYIHPALPEIVRNAARKAKAELDKK
ncbi:MAG: pyridine nucleotide-disulfide oxidoreductase, partial [Patescibacteria group bacterium]